MSGLGHNRGPSMAAGQSWRRHCWAEARAALLPALPIEVVRLRVRRAKELGLDYTTYAGVRATTGRDLVAFLFSSNALGVIHPAKPMTEERSDRVARMVRCDRIGLAIAPVTPPGLLAAVPVLDASHAAPGLWDTERNARRQIRSALGRLPAASVLLVGDSGLERDWSVTALLAGYLPAEKFFGAS